MRAAFCALLAIGLLGVPSALAKDFQPGDLKVCGRDRCVSIEDRALLRLMTSFYWGPARVVHAQRVRPGTRAFQVRWDNGYVSGTFATAKLERFRAYGFYCERFRYGKWYRVPPRTAEALRTLTHAMQPRQVPAVPPHSC